MNADKPDYELRSYGRRRGRKPSARQAALLREVLPRISVDLARPMTLSGEVWLEIGFGGGEHLIWQAEQHPDVTMIGCEPFEDGMVKVLDAVETRSLANIRVHMGDAREVLRWLPEKSISRAFILFPDPWPKRKHQKRRLVNRTTLDLLARAMTAGAELRIGTDIGDYSRSLLEAVAQEPRFAWLARRPDDWRQRPADWPATRYEEKAQREGRRRYYFRFARVEDLPRAAGSPACKD